MRVERLKHLSREEPDRNALDELSEEELRALIIMKKPRDYKDGDEVTMQQAVRWLGVTVQPPCAEYA